MSIKVCMCVCVELPIEYFASTFFSFVMPH